MVQEYNKRSLGLFRMNLLKLQLRNKQCLLPKMSAFLFISVKHVFYWTPSWYGHNDMSSWCIINQVTLYNSNVLEMVFFFLKKLLLSFPFLVKLVLIDVCFLGENDLSVSWKGLTYILDKIAAFNSAHFVISCRQTYSIW